MAAIIKNATKEEVNEALTKVRYRTEFTRTLNTLPDDIAGIKLTGRSLASVRVSVSSFNKRRTDGRKFKVLTAQDGTPIVVRAS